MRTGTTPATTAFNHLHYDHPAYHRGWQASKAHGVTDVHLHQLEQGHLQPSGLLIPACVRRVPEKP